MSTKQRKFPMVVKEGFASVKVYKVKNKGRDSYMVTFKTEEKRAQKMFARLDEALAEAKSKAVAMARGELDVLELRSLDRSIYVHAVEFLRPTGMSLELAAKEYAECARLLEGRGTVLEAVRDFVKRYPSSMPSKMVPEAVALMLQDKEREGISEDYLRVMKSSLERFAASFHVQVRSVTTAQIADFVRDLDVTGRTKNNMRQSIGTFFRYCKERGWLPKDHDGVALVPKFKEHAGDIVIYSPLEVSQFLTYAPAEMIPFLAIGAFAGMRSAEIERLDWSEVHLAERFIEVKAAKSKTASRRLIPVPENLAKWLAPYAQREGNVVPLAKITKHFATLVSFTNAGLKAAAMAAGKDPAKVKKVKWKKNALRHSYISYRVADIQNVNQVALECGNSPAIIFKHYRELVRPAEAKKWFSIEPDATGKITVLPKVADPTHGVAMSR